MEEGKSSPTNAMIDDTVTRGILGIYGGWRSGLEKLDDLFYELTEVATATESAFLSMSPAKTAK